VDPEKKIYLAFYKKRKQYFNELKEETKLSNSSLQNTLKKLEKQNLIKKEKTKSNTFYSIQNKEIASIKFSEIDIEKLNKLNTTIKTPLNEFISFIPKEIHSVLLFGSGSKKKETKDSDIDIMIIAHSFEDKDLQKKYFETILEKVKEAKKEAEVISNHSINYFVITYEEFENHRNTHSSRIHRKTEFFLHKKNHLIQQAKITGFPIKNQQKYHEATLHATE